MKIFFYFSWLWQVGITLIIAYLIFILLRKILNKFGFLIRKRNITLFVIVLAVYIACVLFVAYNPLFICPDEFKNDISEDLQQIIIDDWRGFYSSGVPILPLYLKIENVTQAHNVLVKVKYIYFGSIYYEVEADGIRQVVKPLAE